ncbi:hypothetical protein E3P99_03477 [Wallemia hederae]|uniref:Phosducin domain-containing protein n=1 Tax=Wallemia hederae TaxID=1540922 RepID=A0A4T0FJV8_9BASI|nr:hypothetical protein E3P99_03477 [Wallemia hederae]
MADALEEAVLTGRLFANGLSINERANGDEEEDYRDDKSDGGGSDEGGQVKGEDGYDSHGSENAHRTGVKGVRDDARAHEKKTRAEAHQSEKARSDYIRSKALVMSGDGDDDEKQRTLETENDDEERRARESYRRTRIRQLKMASNGGLRLFGHLRKVDANTYITAIDDEEEDVFVVILIKDNSIDACVDLEYEFAALAQVYTGTKFLSGEATTLEFGLDDDGVPDPDILPTVLVYRAGNLHCSLIRPDPTRPIEHTLAEEGVLQLVERAVDENGDLLDE